ncbi:hypothetical protein B0T21DRAFT_138938 [Apiosordaria backusii]|uniref:Uncharacterized protein n=1 Tax=Apiosordaria backusii TaxID=314023 RepID=A0AA40EF55_9PEZI|nr:hypothetical protein B0T21DRAFT_138938 [Apiosordaria backusii]
MRRYFASRHLYDSYRPDGQHRRSHRHPSYLDRDQRSSTSVISKSRSPDGGDDRGYDEDLDHGSARGRPEHHRRREHVQNRNIHQPDSHSPAPTPGPGPLTESVSPFREIQAGDSRSPAPTPRPGPLTESVSPFREIQAGDSRSPAPTPRPLTESASPLQLFPPLTTGTIPITAADRGPSQYYLPLPSLEPSLEPPSSAGTPCELLVGRRRYVVRAWISSSSFPRRSNQSGEASGSPQLPAARMESLSQRSYPRSAESSLSRGSAPMSRESSQASELREASSGLREVLSSSREVLSRSQEASPRSQETSSRSREVLFRLREALSISREALSRSREDLRLASEEQEKEPRSRSIVESSEEDEPIPASLKEKTGRRSRS